MQEGTYQLALSVPGGNEEPLSKYIQVRVPDRERTHAERNDTLLTSITKETGGIYYRQLETAIHGDKSTPPLSQAIKSRAEIKLVKGAPRQRLRPRPNELAPGHHRRLAVHRMDRPPPKPLSLSQTV